MRRFVKRIDTFVYKIMKSTIIHTTIVFLFNSFLYLCVELIIPILVIPRAISITFISVMNHFS